MTSTFHPVLRRLFLGLFTGVLAAALSVSIPSAPAAHAAATFDPGTLVTDAVFTAKDTMSVGDIQAFLANHGSVLANLPASQLGDGNNGRSAAQIIYDAAHVNRTDFDTAEFGPSNPLVMTLNPEVILVTLQKEQGLITGVYDPSSASTAAALNTAMGMGCPDNSGCLSAYAGFTNQVTYAAAQFMKNYYKASSSPFVPGQTYTITNTTGPPYNAPATQQVTIGNASTSSLYQYTPHVYNGNYNFWYYLNTWFSLSPYRPPLAKDTDGTVYAIDQGGRWAITGAGFVQWGFSWSSVAPITSTQKALPLMGTFTQLAKAEDGTVYYIDQGLKRVITSPRIFSRYGFSWSDVAPIPSSILSQLPWGLPMYELLSATTGDGTVYMATNGTLYPISGDIFNNAWALKFSEVGHIPGYVIANLPQGPLLSRLAISPQGDGTVFLLDRGIGYRVSAAAAQAWNLDLSTIRSVGAPVLNERAAGGLLSTLVRQDGGDGTVYLVKGGQKLPVTHTAWVRNGYSFSSVQNMSASLLSALPTGATLN